jgi:hypothetical protein
MRTDGRTDMNLIIIFRSFAKAPENDWIGHLKTYIHVTDIETFSSYLTENKF